MKSKTSEAKVIGTAKTISSTERDALLHALANEGYELWFVHDGDGDEGRYFVFIEVDS